MNTLVFFTTYIFSSIDITDLNSQYFSYLKNNPNEKTIIDSYRSIICCYADAGNTHDNKVFKFINNPKKAFYSLKKKKLCTS